MTEKKQENPAALRVPKAIELDFRRFVDELKARSFPAFIGRCAGAALLRFMLDDETTQKRFYGLASTYVQGEVNALRAAGKKPPRGDAEAHVRKSRDASRSATSKRKPRGGGEAS